MLHQFLSKVILIGILTTLVSCEGASTSNLNPPSPSAATKALVIGDVSNNPAKKIKRYQQMADYLTKNLKEFNLDIGEVKITSDLESMSNLLKSGEVDIYFDSPYPAMIVSEKSGAQPILRRWKGGRSDYYGVIFTLKKNKIKSLSNLKGKMIAFDEPNSTSGYLLPIVSLLEAGFNPREKSSANAEIKEDEIGYVFSDDDENTIQWIISGKVTAGVVDIGTFQEIPVNSRGEMTVLAETEKIARHLVMIRPDMPPEMIAAIKKILLDMDKTPEGKEVLASFENTTKFDDFPTEENIKRMKELYELVKDR